MEELRRSIEETQAALIAKLELLEGQVRNTVALARAGVTDTVASFHEAVSDVGETFQVEHQVKRHPWTMLAGSVACGVLAGCYLASRTGPLRGELRALKALAIDMALGIGCGVLKQVLAPPQVGIDGQVCEDRLDRV
jgi:hypothetical protein